MQGRSQDFREGGADRANFGHTHLQKWKGRSSNHHQEHVLNVASQLKSRFSTEFWDKISF